MSVYSLHRIRTALRFSAVYLGPPGHGYGHGHGHYSDPTRASDPHLGFACAPDGLGATSTLNVGVALVRRGRGVSETSPCPPQDGTPCRTRGSQRAHPPGTYVLAPDHHDRQSHRHRERALSHDDRPDYL